MRRYVAIGGRENLTLAILSGAVCRTFVPLALAFICDRTTRVLKR